MNLSYGDNAFWNMYYENKITHALEFTNFDWYCTFDGIFPMINRVHDTLSSSQKALIIGVGSSEMVEYLYRQGFRDITCIDISTTLIRKMQQKYQHLLGVDFLCLDVKDLVKFPTGYFTLILDKGCLDAIFCSLDCANATCKALAELHRVLGPECIFACVSHGSPSTRVPTFRTQPV